MYPRELIMKLKVVYHVVSDDFYFDQNPVQCTVSLKITVSDIKNHKICEFGQIWRLPEREQYKIGSLSYRYKLFKVSFPTTFISIKHYVIKSEIYLSDLSNLEFFKPGKFWRLLGGERFILEGNW